MVLKLYGYLSSGATRRAMMVMHEFHVPYKVVTTDPTKAGDKLPELLEKQPFCQVPWMDDDGFILYESRAISRYIATKYAHQGPKLIPTDLKANALFEQAASIELSNFDPFVRAIAHEKFAKKWSGLEANEAMVQSNTENLDAKLDGYERMLSKQKYLAGDEITLADLFHLPLGSYLPSLGLDELISKRPNVKRWFDDISSRESWKAANDGI